MSSFREQLKQGAFQRSKTIQSKIHKFIGNFTITEEGYCEFDFSKEENFFLLKASWINSKRCEGECDKHVTWCKITLQRCLGEGFSSEKC